MLQHQVIQDDLTVSFESPSVEEFSSIRSRVLWGETDLQMAVQALANSLFHVCIRDRRRLIAMGRVIGDGALYFYIQDVMVDPDYQNRGPG